MNSARVAGGSAPRPLHSIFPEPQSAVMQEKELLDSNCVQRVRPQIRPDQDLGIVIVVDFPLRRVKPVVGSGGEVAPESKPGHIVCRHRFTNLKEAASSSVSTIKVWIFMFQLKTRNDFDCNFYLGCVKIFEFGIEKNKNKKL